VVAVALVAAVAIDWLLLPSGYPVAVVYGIPLLLAAHRLTPSASAVTSSVALVLNGAGSIVKAAPTSASVAESGGLLAMGVLAVLLARQRHTTEGARRRLELQDRAARALAEGDTLQAASAAILGVMARYLGWTHGALWCIDSASGVLTCLATWHQPGVGHDTFESLTQSQRFAQGVGLPGRVWVEGRPVWIPDVQQAMNFPRRAAAGDAALHSGLAFRVRHGDDLLGVMEFFSPQVEEPDEALLAVLDAVGQQVGLFLARRRAEDHVAELLVRERTARTEAEAAIRAREEFLSVAAHELKTPLTSLRGYAQLLEREFERHRPPNRERIHRAASTIQTQSDKLGGLIAQLLDVSRIQSGKLAVEQRPSDLSQLVRDVANAARGQLRGHTLKVEVPPNVEAFVDPLRVEQVLTNLLDNAIKYSPQGGPIEVAVAAPDPVRGMVELAVTDRGIGIPPEDRPYIFERYYRAHTANYASGMGLGLYISHQIVELHGGQLRAEFPSAGGTRFIVTLPTRLEPERQG
jgi:signal transduction histidine kinase